MMHVSGVVNIVLKTMFKLVVEAKEVLMLMALLVME